MIPTVTADTSNSVRTEIRKGWLDGSTSEAMNANLRAVVTELQELQETQPIVADFILRQASVFLGHPDILFGVLLTSLTVYRMVERQLETPAIDELERIFSMRDERIRP